ncbi:TetR/AcrR family transcriptional regulator [Flavobacterium sp. XS2P39]|uniref:TetR/AcrR family transcriptional regulator n=1 Tax=Flavobacterium sp. XS2P39 TaxID=3401725 RepID=UPI003AACBDB8
MNKSERTRQYIIEKTAPIFNTKGYAGTSLSDMTEATGLTKGSVYGNFKNKDEVAIAVFEYNFGRLLIMLNSEISKRKTYREKLLCFPELYLNFLGDKFPVGGCPIMNTAIEADDTHKDLKNAAKKALLKWFDSFVYLINKGKEKGEFKSTTNAEDKALVIISLIEGAIMITKVTGKTNYLKSLMGSLKTIIEDF